MEIKCKYTITIATDIAVMYSDYIDAQTHTWCIVIIERSISNFCYQPYDLFIDMYLEPVLVKSFYKGELNNITEAISYYCSC